MRSFSYTIKHTFSVLSDQAFVVDVDDGSKTVTVKTKTFDSALLEHILRSVLPNEGVVAFVDDNTRKTYGSRPPFALKIRIGADDGNEGVLFNAQAVVLFEMAGKSDMSITLSLAK